MKRFPRIIAIIISLNTVTLVPTGSVQENRKGVEKLTTFGRDAALAFFLDHSKDPGHMKHALAVEAAMRHFAEKMNGDVDLWGVTGLLHDVDWEVTMENPEEHTAKAVEWLREAGWPEEIVRAVRSHSWKLLQDETAPETDMEKTLYAIDELTGFVTAVALVRPSRSVQDLKVKSVKKKFKDKAFARGVDRETIKLGAELMGVSLEELMEGVIEALKPVEAEIGLGGGEA